LVDVPFVWFPRRSSPVFFDHLVAKCARGGLNAPHIVQRPTNPFSSALSHVGLGSPSSAVLRNGDILRACRSLRVTDLNLRLPIALIWRKDNTSPLLTNFTADVKALVERSRRRLG
jgi:hypothetical protein